MKKALACLLALMICVISAACSSTFGMEEQNVSLNIGDYVLLGKYNDAPILWRCMDIDENGMLIVSDKMLCFKMFGETDFWRDSFLRKWLNSTVPEGMEEWKIGRQPERLPYVREKGFLHDDNFSQSERDVMKTVTQWTMLPEDRLDLSENGEIKAYNGVKGMTPGGSVTEPPGPICYEISELPEVYYGAAHQVEDTVFLLDEMQIYRIWCTFGTVKTTRTPDAQGASGYFLRTPYDGAAYDITWDDSYYRLMGCTNHDGIRPVFYLNETSAQIVSGSGTETDPYVIDGKKNDDIHVYCDWTELRFDVQPVNENGRVLVPMRKIFETLGASITWDESTRTVTAVKGETTVSLQIDQREMYVNGEMIWLDVPPRIVGDRTLIPLRAVSEALGAKVEWIEDQRRVNITT